MFTPHHRTIFFPITASRAKSLTSRGAVKSHIPSTNFAFSRILHYISVNSWIPGKRSLATKLCPSQVSFENYRSNIVDNIIVSFCFCQDLYSASKSPDASQSPKCLLGRCARYCSTRWRRKLFFVWNSFK